MLIRAPRPSWREDAGFIAVLWKVWVPGWAGLLWVVVPPRGRFGGSQGHSLGSVMVPMPGKGGTKPRSLNLCAGSLPLSGQRE